MVLKVKIRLIELDYPGNPHLNMATDEAIFQEVAKGNSPPTLRFYRNEKAVILGCFQLAEEEIDIRYAIQNGIEIAKRFTGGGAIYQDMGGLNYSIITKDLFDIGMSMQKLFAAMMRGALRSIKKLGLDAISDGLNGVIINDKKVLESAASIRSSALLFHATVLVDTDMKTFASVLKFPGVKSKDKSTNAIQERIANVYDLSRKGIDDVRRHILDSYAEELGFEYEKGKLTEKETALANRLYKDKYRISEWNLGRSFISI